MLSIDSREPHLIRLCTQVTLVPQPELFKVRCVQLHDNKGSKEAQITRGLQTELSIDPADFDVYNIAGDDTELTFTLRELKALLSFCDFASQNVEVYYDTGGR